MLWKVCFGITALLTLQFFMEIGYQMYKGIGIWRLNHPAGGAVHFTSFVFWIGIGHAGTPISAILHLFRQRWRTAINRSAEAMTIFAVMTAGLFPLIHLGRTWFAYWLLPYPNWRVPSGDFPVPPPLGGLPGPAQPPHSDLFFVPGVH